MIINIITFLSGILAIIAFIPYLLEIFRGKVQPHLYSWLVWSILQAVAVAAIVTNGGGLKGSISLLIGSVLCTLIMLISLKYGTKNITRSDSLCLIGAFLALALYFSIENAVYSVILITLIDFLAFIPTLRKAYQEPESENATLFALSAISQLLALFVLTSFTFTTATYIGSLAITNWLCVLFIFLGKKRLQTLKP